MCTPSQFPRSAQALASLALMEASATTATDTTPSAAPETPAADAPANAPAADLPAGTRRKRLWDLETNTHCPIVGVCVPMPALRRLADKTRYPHARADDYTLHCHAVGECRQRGVLSEALQKHLDQRFALVMRRAAQARSREALAAWWAEASAGQDLPGALWSTLTHPRCDATLAHDVLGQVHMLQHQVGMATRVDLARLDALIDENAVLTRALAAAQGRNLQQAAAFGARVDELEAERLRQRAQHIGAQTEIAQLREQLTLLEASTPHLRERRALAADVAELRAALQDTRRALGQARDELQRLRAAVELPRPPAGGPPREPARDLLLRDTPAPTATLPPRPAPGAHEHHVDAAALAEAAALAGRAVLCVGGRPSAVPAYRSAVERIGGRFLHHDGGEEDNPARLDATLAAADLVICQAGCVSHGAYWRVKDHCKRTGKRCLFVDTPSRSALERALVAATAT